LRKKMNLNFKLRKFSSLVAMVLFVFPASSHFKLEGFSLGNAGGGVGGSGSRTINASLGEIGNNQMVGNSFNLGAGLAWMVQQSVPRAPTFVNDGSYNNQLHLTINNTNLTNGSTAFPGTPVLDDFNRTNGGIGASWGGGAGAYTISSNQVVAAGNDGVGNIWSGVGSTFGTEQEAHVKLVTVSTTAAEHDLLLKCQDANSANNCIEILYDQASKKVQVWTSVNNSWTQRGSDIGVTFASGDVMGARATNDGIVRIYKNGNYVGGADYSPWTYANYGGYIGLWIIDSAASVVLDDFGGGNYTATGSGSVAMPSDVKYAVAISKDNFATTQFVKSDMTVGTSLTSADYMSYSAWGGASGTLVVGLDVGTTYSVKVKAIQGMYTESAYGPKATAGTTNGQFTFAIGVSDVDAVTSPPYLIDLGSLYPGSLVTSPTKVWVHIDTNAANGGSVFVYGQNGGLYSVTSGFTISSLNGDLGSLSTGIGLQGSGPSQSAGGPLTVVSPYNSGGNTVGVGDTAVRQIFVSENQITAGTASFMIKAKSDNSTPEASDYSETITVIAAANF
jgi:hypothetical protein